MSASPSIGNSGVNPSPLTQNSPVTLTANVSAGENTQQTATPSAPSLGGQALKAQQQLLKTTSESLGQTDQAEPQNTSQTSTSSTGASGTRIFANERQTAQVQHLVQELKNEGASDEDIQQAFEDPDNADDSTMEALEQLQQNLNSNGTNKANRSAGTSGASGMDESDSGDSGGPSETDKESAVAQFVASSVGTPGTNGKSKTNQSTLGHTGNAGEEDESEQQEEQTKTTQASSKPSTASPNSQKSVDMQQWGEGKANDSVWSALKGAGWSDQEIANNHLVDQVAKANKLQDPNVIQAGQKLVVPLKQPPANQTQNAGTTAQTASSKTQPSLSSAQQSTQTSQPQSTPPAASTQTAATNQAPAWKVKGKPLTQAEANLIINDRVNQGTGGQVLNYAANNGTLTPAQMRQEANQYLSTLTPAQRQDLMNRANAGGNMYSQQYGMTKYGGMGAFLAANGQNDSERHLGADLYLSNKMAIANQLGMLPQQAAGSPQAAPQGAQAAPQNLLAVGPDPNGAQRAIPVTEAQAQAIEQGKQEIMAGAANLSPHDGAIADAIDAQANAIYGPNPSDAKSQYVLNQTANAWQSGNFASGGLFLKGSIDYYNANKAIGVYDAPQAQQSASTNPNPPHGPGLRSDPKNGNVYALEGTPQGTYNGLPYFNDPQMQQSHPGFVEGDPVKIVGPNGNAVAYGQSYYKIQGNINGLPILDIGNAKPPTGFTGYLRQSDGSLKYVVSEPVPSAAQGTNGKANASSSTASPAGIGGNNSGEQQKPKRIFIPAVSVGQVVHSGQSIGTFSDDGTSMLADKTMLINYVFSGESYPGNIICEGTVVNDSSNNNNPGGSGFHIGSAGSQNTPSFNPYLQNLNSSLKPSTTGNAPTQQQTPHAANAQPSAVNSGQGNPANPQAASQPSTNAANPQKSVDVQQWGEGKANDSVWSALKNAGWSDQEIVNNHLVDQVAKANNLQDPNVIQAGQKLIVPLKQSPANQTQKQTNAGAPQTQPSAASTNTAPAAQTTQAQAKAPAAPAQPQTVLQQEPWLQQGKPLTQAEADFMSRDPFDTAAGHAALGYASTRGTLTPAQMKQEVNQYLSTLTPAQRQELMNRATAGGAEFSHEFGMSQYAGMGAYLTAYGQNDAEKHLGADLYVADELAIGQQAGILPQQ